MLKKLFFAGISKVNDENSRIWDPDPGSGSISQRHGSADPDPLQNVMDPQHWLYVLEYAIFIYIKDGCHS